VVYNDVIENNYHLLLPKKKKYTKTDYKKLLKLLPELEYKQIFFIVKCTAIYHDTEYSKFFNSLVNIMFT